MFGDYDEDLNDSNQRCKHGTFIGSWWGPDYLCGLCEMGADYHAHVDYTLYSLSIVTDGERFVTPTNTTSREKIEREAAMWADLLPGSIVTIVERSDTREVWMTYDEAVSEGIISPDDDDTDGEPRGYVTEWGEYVI